MERYYVNGNAQQTGEHEVHKESCRYLPGPLSRIDLGLHPNCNSAVLEARRRGYNADGCAFCCPACHTR
jgi:hypothetical protein